MTRPVSPLVAQVGTEISQHLAQIQDLFKPGTKVTLVARGLVPDGSQDMIVTTEQDLADVIRTLQIHRDEGSAQEVA